MDDVGLLLWIAVALTALAAAVLGGITGMGTGIVTLPVLVTAFGVREAVPIVTIAMLFNTASRIIANRAYIDRRVVLWHSAGAIPGAVLGAVVFANAPVELLARGLGGFLLALVVWRHLPIATVRGMRVQAFLPVGAGQGFFSALFGGAGPFGAHFLLSYGLVKNAFVGTVAVSTFGMNVTKALVYGGYDLVDRELLATAVVIGLIMAAGAYAGARIVQHVTERAFTIIVEGIMVGAGLTLIVQG